MRCGDGGRKSGGYILRNNPQLRMRIVRINVGKMEIEKRRVIVRM